MPRRPAGPCTARAGCPHRLPCPIHQDEAKRMADQRRPTARQRGYDTQWERTRAEHLELEPLCTWPGCHATATDVDHIDGQGPLGPRGHDHDNLQSLCHPHHSAKTARHDGAFGRPKGVG